MLGDGRRRRRGHRRRHARHQRSRRAAGPRPCSTPATRSRRCPGPAAAVAGARHQRAADRPVRVRGLPARGRAGPGPSGWPSWPAERRTIVLYEAPHRMLRTIADLAAALGADRRGRRGPGADEAPRDGRARARSATSTSASRAASTSLVVAGAPVVDRRPRRRRRARGVRAELAAGASRRDAAAAVAERLGVPRRVAYDLAVAEPSRGPGTTVTAARRP